MRPEWRNRIWKYLTALVVLLLILNPEFLDLAIFIDAVGLEAYFTLLATHLVLLWRSFYSKFLRPILQIIGSCVKFYVPSLINQRDDESRISILFSTAAPALTMCFLVFSYMINMLSIFY